MSTFIQSWLTLFDFMASKGKFDVFISSSTTETQLIPLYFFAFEFNLLLLLFFIVIIMITYNELRPKMYLLTKALGEIKSEKTKIFLNKWLNLITMKIPAEFQETDNIKGKAITINSRLTTFDIFKYNLENLDIDVRLP